MATRMQQRRGTAEQWTTANPVLAGGEIGFETDSGKFKLGDGVNTWTNLSYFLNSEDLGGALGEYATEQYVDTAIENVVGLAPATLDTLVELAAAIGDDESFSTTIFNATEIAKQEAITLAETYTDSQIAALSNTFTDFTDADSEIQASVTALSTDLEGVSTAVNDHTLELSNLTTDLNTVNTELNGIATTVSGHTLELSNLATDLISQGTALGATNDALLLKASLADPTFTGTVVLPTTTSVGDVSSAELGHLNGVTSAIQTQIDAKAPTDNPTFTGTVVGVTKEMVGLNDVDNTADTAKPVSTATQAALDLKAPLESPTFTGTVAGVTKTHVGLDNVDNTSDADKPVSTATQTALDAKASLAGATFTGDVTVETDVVIEGNLTISGSTTTVNATDLSITDPLIYLAAEQYTTDVLDVGFLAATGEVGGTEESHLHSGFFRDVSDSGKWKIVSNVPHPVNNTVDITNAVKDTLVVGNLEADGVVFGDGIQTKVGVPSLTEFVEKTASYTLDALTLRDGIVEMNSSSATTFTIPLNATLAWPVGASMDILGTGTGEVTILGADGVTINSTPGLKLRTQWSSATILKRSENSWIAYGDLKA